MPALKHSNFFKVNRYAKPTTEAVKRSEKRSKEVLG